ncbi:unnamed protein product [Nezara viridula]|uniref:Neuropeptide n=1 Tax=Nezara viridula TaxID=85310 RepID=A0A9P0H5U6_NEZVI|nr:unnamed protein product [Nezara viridula]
MRRSRQLADMRLLLLFLVPLVAEGSILGAIHSLLNYNEKHEPSEDFLFGAILAKGQLSATKVVNKDIANDIEILKEIIDRIFEKNGRFYINKDSVGRVEESMKILKKDGVERLRTEGDLPYDLEYNFQYGTPSMFNSTVCITEAFLANKITDFCLSQMTDESARGYTLSHQVLYFSLAASMSPLPFTRDLLDKRCARVLTEVTSALRNGLPVKFRDLFVEEVAVCGLSNYSEFLTKPVLDFILSLQHPNGCFSLAGPLDKCNEHLSAVSMLALTNFLYAHSQGKPFPFDS